MPRCHKHHRLENIWRRDKTNNDKRNSYKMQTQKVLNLNNTLKEKYYKSIIGEKKEYFCGMYKVVNHLLHRKPVLPLPRHNST